MSARSKAGRMWAVVGIAGAMTVAQLVAPATAFARDYVGEAILLCHDAGVGFCQYHPAGLPTPEHPYCPAVAHLDGNGTSAEDLIKSVTFLDRNCANTRTTVVGHSIGAVRAESAARHFGPGYHGHARFVLNAGTSGPEVLRSLPPGTVMNCNYGDTVCDRQHGSIMTYSIHMPQYYPSWYENNRPGFNLIRANGVVERPYG